MARIIFEIVIILIKYFSTTLSKIAYYGAFAIQKVLYAEELQNTSIIQHCSKFTRVLIEHFNVSFICSL